MLIRDQSWFLASHIRPLAGKISGLRRTHPTSGNFVKLTAKLIRALAKGRFRLFGLATIKDIPTARFNSLIAELQADEWVLISEYDGVDAWIDYGCIRLKRGSITLRLEWDNWTEGSVEGPRDTIMALAQEKGLDVTTGWRWSEYDDS